MSVCVSPPGLSLRTWTPPQVWTFIFGASETSSTALSYAIFLLARHPEAQERVREEIAEVTGGQEPRRGRELLVRIAEQRRTIDPRASLSVSQLCFVPPRSIERLSEFVYLDLVVKECLRLYPPTATNSRSCVADCVVRDGAGRELRLEKGTEVLFSLRYLHRSPKYWTDPEAFKPERFAPGPDGRPQEPSHPYAYRRVREERLATSRRPRLWQRRGCLPAMRTPAFTCPLSPRPSQSVWRGPPELHRPAVRDGGGQDCADPPAAWLPPGAHAGPARRAGHPRLHHGHPRGRRVGAGGEGRGEAAAQGAGQGFQPGGGRHRVGGRQVCAHDAPGCMTQDTGWT